MKKVLFIILSVSFFCKVLSQNNILQYGHSGWISTLKVSPDNLSLATGGSNDGQVILWDINLRQVKSKYQTYGNRIDNIAFNPNNKQLAAIDGQGNIFVWNTEANTLEHQFQPGGFGPIVYDSQSETSKYFSPNRSQSIGGGVLLFVDNNLYVGMGFPNQDIQSSLFKIDLKTETISAVNNMLKNNYDEYLGIAFLDQIDHQNIVLQFGKFSDKSSVVIFNINELKIEKYLIKNKPNIESVSMSEDRNKIAIVVDEDYEPKTYIFDLNSRKRTDKINYGGELTWQGENLWIGYTDEVRNYNTQKREFQNYFEAGEDGSVNHIKYLDKHQKLLINHGRSTYLINPLNLQLLSSTDRWFSKNIDKSITLSEFIDDKSVLVQYFNYDINKPYTEYEKYIWNIETNTVTEFLPHKKKSAIQSTNANVIYGYDLDSTKTAVKYFDEKEYTDPSTLDFYKFSDGKFLLDATLDYNIIKWNKNSETMFVYDDNKNIHLVNYKTSDTLVTLKEKLTNLNNLNLFYDKSSGNIAVYNDNYPNDDTLKFFRASDDYSTPFYEYKSDYLKILGYDDKRRLLTNSESYQERIINIANPQKFTLVDDNFGEIVRFHPSEPWLFYIDNYSNSIVCYDYNRSIKIGGYTINNDDSYESGIRNLSVNTNGDKLLVWLNNDTLYAISVSGFTDTKTISEYNQPVDQISDYGKFLSLNSAIINLSNLQIEKKFNKNSYTKLFKNYALNFEVNRYDFNSKIPAYLIQTKYYFKSQKSKTDSINISDIGLSKYYKPIFLSGDQYLFFENAGDRYNPGLKILDLKSNTILIDDAKLYYKPDFKSDDNKVTFYSNHAFYTWKKGSKTIDKKDISSNNFYINLPEYTVINTAEDNVLKSELNGLISYNLNNTKVNDTLIIPEAYTRINLLSKTNDSLIWSSVFSKQEKAFGLVSFNPESNTWKSFIPLASRPNKIMMTNAKEYLVVVLSTGEVQLRDPNNGTLLVNMYQDADSNITTVTDDGFYTSSNPNKVAFLKEIDGNVFYDKLLDFNKNRPDKVLSSIGKANKTDIKLYKKASELRRQFFNIKNSISEHSNNSFVQIDYANQDFTVNKKTVSIAAKDNENHLNISQVINGQVLDDLDINSKPLVNLPISYGENHIQLFTNNSTLGKEVKITSKLKEENENLIVCTISVSKYKDADYNLNYAVKDGKDIVNAFKKQSDAYTAIKPYHLYDEEVTKENIEQLIKQIDSNPNDKIIFFLSGHGLLDNGNNFFFATHDVDFNNPKDRGMGLTYFQQLLSKLKSQKKLLFIDACYSGLVDTSETSTDEAIVSDTDNNTIIKEQSFNTKGAKASSAKTTSNTSTKSAFELMQNVFSSFSSSTGLETITAASGNSVALESPRWQNGSFTYAIKLGLLDYQADANGNGIITVNELKNYILETVPKITNGTQQPTSREANKYLNWNIWY